MKVSLSVNGRQRTDDVEPRVLLVHYLRDVCGQRAANVGCDTSSCGACTVLVDGEAVKSCTLLCVQADGSQITTAEGLASAGRRASSRPSRLSRRTRPAMRVLHPRMIMATVGLLTQNRNPTEQQIAKVSKGIFAAAPETTHRARSARRRRGNAMIPACFDYVRAEDADHAVHLLAQYGEDARLLAGGHCLIPMMKLRLARPSVLIDIGRIRDLRFIRLDGDDVVIGALTRDHDIETSDIVRADLPLLAHVAAQVGAPQVRARRTIGGSLAHGDAASDLPTAVLALGGTMVIHGPSGVRSVAATDFFKGPFTTAIEPHEILVEVRLPRPSGPGWAYQRFAHRANDWPIVAVATVDGRVALANSAETVIRAHATENAISAGASIRETAQLADREATPRADIHGSIDFHRHLIRVLTERTLQAAVR